MHKILLYCFLIFKIALFAVDYDCITVGSSPILLLEALYKHHSNKRVLIVEKAKEMGGAWKSIDILGISNVDMGCHVMGSDLKLIEFLRKYIGVDMRPMVPWKNHPSSSNSSKNSGQMYPSKGCFELVNNLEKLIKAAGFSLWLEHLVEKVHYDANADIVEVWINGKKYTCSKLVFSTGSEIKIDNISQKISPYQRKYPHIYLLIEDSLDDTFIYSSGGGANYNCVVRISNLTQYVGLQDTGKKIFAFEMRNIDYLNHKDDCFDLLKKKNTVSENASILLWDTYTYERFTLSNSLLDQLGTKAKQRFEMINTSVIWNISQNIKKYEKVFPKYKQIFP